MAVINQTGVPVLASVSHDMELVLPISMIREHTKTDDVATVSDAQLVLYRKAAVETAEEYTGLLIGSKRPITEPVLQPNVGYQRQTFVHNTRFSFADPLAYYFGLRNMPTTTLQVPVGAQSVILPIMSSAFGMDCCNPCPTVATMGQLMYMAGYGCEADIPARFVVGALKYIAHLIENPGDMVRASDRQMTGLAGNNPALASGAIDIWRTIKPDAI